MKRQTRDSIFDPLYRELRDELDGARYLYVNDTAGFNIFFRECLLRLCIEYSIKSKGNDETS